MSGITLGSVEKATAIGLHVNLLLDSLFAHVNPLEEFYKVQEPVLFRSMELERGVFGHN